MNKLTVTAFLILFIPSLVFSQDLQNGLLAYYPFNGNANDESGNGNDGTVSGASLTADRLGNSNSAYLFDGVNDLITISPGNFNVGTGDFTIAAWVNADNIGRPARIFSDRINCNAGQGGLQLLTLGDGTVNGGVCRSGGGEGAVSTTSILGGWFHVIALRQSSILSVYIDGSLESSTTAPRNANNSSAAEIGGTVEFGSEDQFLKGRIDEVRIYNRAISGVEIDILADNHPDPNAGLTAFYPFNGNANDESGNGNNGTVNGATLTNDRFGNSNSAYFFDGVGDFVNIPHNTNLNLSELSVAAWIFIDPAENANEFNAIVGKSDGSSASGGFSLAYDARNIPGNPRTTNALDWAFNGGTGTLSIAFLSNAFLNPGFHHVAGTFDGSVSRLYLDGVLVATGSPIGGVSFNTLSLRIGAMHVKEVFGVDDRFEGIIDEVEIYNRALSDSEVQALFGGGTSSPAGRITFESTRDGNSEIYIMNDDGTNQVNLTHSLAADINPAISPDGQYIAFASNRAGRTEVFRMKVDGSEVTQLTSNATANGPDFIEGLDWHRDGSKLIFAVRRDDPEQIWKIFQVNNDGTGFAQLTVGPLDAVFPRYSLDATQIYMQRNTPFNGFTSEIYLSDPNGTNMTRLTFSANGSTTGASRIPAEGIENGIPRVFFARDSGFNRGQIYSMNTDGSGQQNISNNSFNETWPMQARGVENEMIFMSNRSGDGIFNVWKMNVDGSNAVQLTTVGGTNPSWWGGSSNDFPVANAGEDQTVECNSPGSGQAVLDGSGSTDPDGDPLTFTWTGPFGTVNGFSPTVTLLLGTHTITLTVDDGNGGIDTDEVTVDVVDTTAPVLTSGLKLVEGDNDDDEEDNFFAVQCSATDNCSGSLSLTSIMQAPSLTNPAVEFKVKKVKKLKFDLKKNEVKVEGPDPQGLWAAVQNAGGVAVNDGQVLKLKVTGGQKHEFKFDKDGNLKEVKGTEAPTLVCTATDAAGNVSADTVRAVLPPDDDDGDEDKAKRLTTTTLDHGSQPSEFALAQNHPNPFNPETEIRFQLPETTHIQIRIFNTRGQEIRTLVNANFQAGFHQVRWDSKNNDGNLVASGIYLYELKSNSFREVRKMSLVR